MIRFFKDYWEIQKIGINFLKKHWFGTIVLSWVVGILTFLSIGGISIIQDKIDDIKYDIQHRNEKE